MFAKQRSRTHKQHRAALWLSPSPFDQDALLACTQLKVSGHGVTITQVPDETAAEVARRERERLRAQTQAKRQQLEKMRAQDMFSGSETEVRHLPVHG